MLCPWMVSRLMHEVVPDGPSHRPFRNRVRRWSLGPAFAAEVDELRDAGDSHASQEDHEERVMPDGVSRRFMPNTPVKNVIGRNRCSTQLNHPVALMS